MTGLPADLEATCAASMTKSACHQRRMHDHFFRRQLSGVCNNALRPLGRLRWDPCLSAVGPDLHGAIHWLHASMGSERKLVDRFDLFRTGRENGVCRAFVADNFSRLGGVREKLFLKLCCRFLRRGAFVPFHFESVAALDRGPGIVGKYSDSAGGRSAASAGLKWNDVANAGHGFRFRGVKRSDFAAKDRTPRDHCKKHARHTGIDAELGGTGSFSAAFKTPRVVADDGEIVRVLERNGIEIRNWKL